MFLRKLKNGEKIYIGSQYSEEKCVSKIIEYSKKIASWIKPGEKLTIIIFDNEAFHENTGVLLWDALTDKYSDKIKITHTSTVNMAGKKTEEYVFFKPESDVEHDKRIWEYISSHI